MFSEFCVSCLSIFSDKSYNSPGTITFKNFIGIHTFSCRY